MPQLINKMEVAVGHGGSKCSGFDPKLEALDDDLVRVSLAKV